MPQSRPSHKTPRSWLGPVLFVALVSLLALTAWNVTSSTAIEEASKAYSIGDLPHALQYALDHLGARPWSREAAVLAANCLSRMDYALEAEPYYRRAGALSLSDWQIRAYGLARGPHPERAIPVYEKILARWPENVTALRRLAAILLAQEKMPAAHALSERLLAIPSGAVIGQTLRAVVYHNQQNHQQAAAAFEKVLELDPELGGMPLSRSLFWTQFTDDLIASGRVREARDALRTYLAKTSDTGLLNRLGQVYLLEGSLDDAERSFTQARESNPNEYAPYLSLAKLALQRHEPKLALEHLKQAKLLAPREYSVLYTLESVYRQLGQTTQADRIQEDLKRLRSQASTLPGFRQWRAYEL
jgi:tetratricopeptide (TPR) repeat protein